MAILRMRILTISSRLDCIAPSSGDETVSVLLEEPLHVREACAASSSARRSSTRAFCGFRSSRGDEPELVVVDLHVAADVAGGHAASCARRRSPSSACAASASSAGLVMLPLPTPAITMPFAPAATAASMMAPSMFSWAMTMSTRGSAVTPSSENSLSIVCLPTGPAVELARRRRPRCRSARGAATGTSAPPSCWSW